MLFDVFWALWIVGSERREFVFRVAFLLFLDIRCLDGFLVSRVRFIYF